MHGKRSVAVVCTEGAIFKEVESRIRRSKLGEYQNGYMYDEAKHKCGSHEELTEDQELALLELELEEEASMDARLANLQLNCRHSLSVVRVRITRQSRLLFLLFCAL